MNILIITPIHPVAIVDMNELYSKYLDNNNVYSIQSMALLSEETEQKHNYIISNLLYTTIIKDKPQLVFNNINNNIATDVPTNLIMFGNLDKHTNINFDHILCYQPEFCKNDKERFDLYLDEINNTLINIMDDNDAMITKCKNIEWYKPEDAEYNFPTLHHLYLFLKTLGIKETKQNGIQS